MVLLGTFWYFLVLFGSFWYFLVFSGILWYFLIQVKFNTSYSLNIYRGCSFEEYLIIENRTISILIKLGFKCKLKLFQCLGPCSIKNMLFRAWRVMRKSFYNCRCNFFQPFPIFKDHWKIFLFCFVVFHQTKLQRAVLILYSMGLTLLKLIEIFFSSFL